MPKLVRLSHVSVYRWFTQNALSAWFSANIMLPPEHLPYSYSFITRCLGSVITFSRLNHTLAELLK